MEPNASIAKMMMVAAKDTEGAFWEEATSRHQKAFLGWQGFLATTCCGRKSEFIVH